MTRAVTRVLANRPATRHDSFVRWSRHPLALVAILTATSIFALGTVGGLSYLWCAPMGEARLHCCCPEDEDARSHETVRRLCCETREMAELPSARIDHGAELAVPTAPALAVLPVLSQVREPVGRALAFGPAPRPVVRVRGSPGRRVHSDCSVYLL